MFLFDLWAAEWRISQYHRDSCRGPIRRLYSLLGEGTEDVRFYQMGCYSAEIQHLYSLSRVLPVRNRGFVRRALTWLGHRLVVWGSCLQERYGTAVEPPVAGATSATR